MRCSAWYMAVVKKNSPVKVSAVKRRLFESDDSATIVNVPSSARTTE